MPYIKKDRRLAIATSDEGGECILAEAHVQDAGELNFAITTLCLDYERFYGRSYKVFNEIIGALECAKLEMYRRMIAPYEDMKVVENGDVF